MPDMRAWTCTFLGWTDSRFEAPTSSLGSQLLRDCIQLSPNESLKTYFLLGILEELLSSKGRTPQSFEDIFAKMRSKQA